MIAAAKQITSYAGLVAELDGWGDSEGSWVINNRIIRPLAMNPCSCI